MRDECTYLRLSTRFVEDQGITASNGWLWAPGYPWLLSLHERLTGHAQTVKGTQILVSALCMVLLYKMALRIFREDAHPRRPALVAAWLYALSPHMAFFSIRLWSEVIYGTILLGALLILGWSRDRWSDPGVRKALIGAACIGLLGGVCVLFRGVATYMLPIFVCGILWNRWTSGRAWAQVGLLVGTVVLVVAPYSVHASQKFDRTIISDRTLGQMMWLGNNNYEPITFDYGNGQLSQRAMRRHRTDARPPCTKKPSKKSFSFPEDQAAYAEAKEVWAMEAEDCKTAEGKAWILANKGEFVRRMPMRVAQLVNPHSLLTRHLRWGRWQGIPQWGDELLILFGAMSSMLVMIGGAVGLAVRGRGGMGMVFSGILLYHVAAIAALAGLSRYRVPLEPLLMIYVAGLLTDWRGGLSVLRQTRWRAWVTGVGLLLFVPLVLWYLPAGWPWWREW